MTAPEFQAHELARRIEALEAVTYELACIIGQFEQRAAWAETVDPLYAATADDAAVRTEACPRCNGNGGTANAGDCPTCDGDGLIHVLA